MPPGIKKDGRGEVSDPPEFLREYLEIPYDRLSFDMFARGWNRDLWEVSGFNELWLDVLEKKGESVWSPVYETGARPDARIYRADLDTHLDVVNFTSYDYLGFGMHPKVLKAAHEALDTYGLGAAGSPLTCGTQRVHRNLEEGLRDFFKRKDGDVTLFPTGFSANTGTLAALFHAGHLVVLDQYAHASLQEGARLCGAKVLYFRHNDPEHLDHLLTRHAGDYERVLVAAESVYSADGDYGRLVEILETAKRHGAFTLMDEAHSMLVSGPAGRGMCAEAGILDEVDLLIMTFSKGFGGIGGALLANREVCRYVDWYAVCRMFSCAMEPATAAGVLAALELGAGPEGDAARSRLLENTKLFHQLLSQRVPMPENPSWVLPVRFGKDPLKTAVAAYIQNNGLNGSILTFPAVNRNEGRIRLFVTAKHERAHFEKACAILESAGRRFGFLKTGT